MTRSGKSSSESERSSPDLPTDSHPPQLPFSRRIQIPVIAAAATALVRGIGVTLRIEIPGYAHSELVYAAGRRCIFSFWHCGLFPMLWHARNRPIVVLNSMNFDGQWASRVTRSMGFGVESGSSSRGGLRALGALEKRLSQGNDVALAVDGPRGPRYVAKPGPVLLAQRTGNPIICFHAYSERGYRFERAWDQFQLPYPFSRVVIVFSPPIEVPGDANRETLASKLAEMQRMLDRIRPIAESWFTLSAAEMERERVRLNAPLGVTAGEPND